MTERKRERFSAELKATAVRRAREGASLRDLARELDVKPGTIRAWVARSRAVGGIEQEHHSADAVGPGDPLDPELREWLLDESPPLRPPNLETFPVLACRRTVTHKRPPPYRDVHEFHGIRSFLVPETFRDQVLKQWVSYGELHDSSDVGYEEHGRFELGDVRIVHGVPLERIVRFRSFDGWSTAYYEPVDRFTVCQQLHRDSHLSWRDPVAGETIVEGEAWPYTEPPGVREGALIRIRQAELRDYLAARRSGLIIIRQFERILSSMSPLAGVPDPFEKFIPGGEFRFNTDRIGDHLYQAILEDSFWIPPAERTQWHGGWGDEEGAVEFMLRNGSWVTYEEGGENDRFFEPVTFNLDAVRRMSAQPGCSFSMGDLTQGALRLRGGGHVRGVVTYGGQFQCMFAELDRGLSAPQQKQLAAACEIPRQERLYSDDWIKASIEGEFPVTRPLEWTVRRAIEELNAPWLARFQETLLETPPEDDLPWLLRATEPQMESLVDEMLEIQKAILPEHKPSAIKRGLALGHLAADAKAYDDMKVISVCRLVLKQYLGDDSASHVLGCINDARNAKGHRKGKSVAKIIDDYDLPSSSPRGAYVTVLARLLDFLLVFKEATERALGTAVGAAGRRVEDDPWMQMEFARKYLASSLRVLVPPSRSALDGLA